MDHLAKIDDEKVTMVGYTITLYGVSLKELNDKINEEISIQETKGCYLTNFTIEDPKGTINSLYIAHVSFTNSIGNIFKENENK